MYFHGTKPIVLLLFVLVSLAQHALSDNKQVGLLQYFKAYLPGIWPQLTTYVPLPTDRSSCPKPVPGIRKLFQGVDVTNFDFYPQDGFSQGFKSPVLKMSCNSGTSWYDTEGNAFDTTDQMNLGNNPTGAADASVKTFRRTSDIRKEMSATAGLSGSYGFFSFSASTSLKSMERTVRQSNTYVQEVTSVKTTSIVFNTYPSLDKHAQEYVDNYMIGTFDTNRTVYEKFIEMYGTHYFERANLGGDIRVLIETKSNQLSKSSRKDMEVSAKASFNFLIKSGSISFGMEKGKSVTNTQMKATTSTSIKYFGGSANLLMAKGFKTWHPTVADDPWVAKGNLKPIASLITNAEKRKSLEQAVNKHIYRSYYKEMIRSGTKIDVDKVVWGIQQASESMIADRSKKELKELIEYEFIVPTWFRNGVKMCIGYFCYRRNMAPPNYYTGLQYRNKDDSRMSFAFRLYRYPPNWLSKVKLCVRYRGDKDTSCKGSGEFCAVLNNYARLRYNKTAGAESDCNLSWKLSIPSEAPVWMSETKLCLYYGAYDQYGPKTYDGTSSDMYKRCNGAVDPYKVYHMCALTNQWTPYWRDGTTADKKGDCKMSFYLNTLGDSI